MCKTSKFVWVLDNIAPNLSLTIFFGGFISKQFEAPEIYFLVLPLLLVGKCSKLSSYAISKKTNERSFGPPNCFLWVLPLLVIRYSSKLSSYAIYSKTNAPNLRKWQKKPTFGHAFGGV